MSTTSDCGSLGPTQSDIRSPLLTQVVGVSNNPEKICIDDMLQKHCGEFGYWQLRHFVLTSLALALQAFHTMVMIYADCEPAWQCSTAGCSSESKSVCQLETCSWEWIGGARSSTVAEFGLICRQKYKIGLVQSLFFGGCMIGAGVFGHLSDSELGRKGSLLIVCIMNAIFGCLTALSPAYWTYALLRLLTGFSTGRVGLCAFILATEPIGPTMSGISGMSTFYFFLRGNSYSIWYSLYFSIMEIPLYCIFYSLCSVRCYHTSFLV